MPEGSRESFSSYAETDRSNFKVILYSYNYITNITDEISLRLLRMRWTPFRLSVCLAWYCSKYTNRKTVDQRKSKFTKQEDSYCKCDQFCVDTFSLPVSLAATGAVPIPIPRALTRFCRFSFVACSPSPVPHIWMDGSSGCWRRLLYYSRPLLGSPVGVLVVLGVIQIQVWHCLCLLWLCCQNCKSSPVFHYGCWLMTMPVESLVLASRLFVFSTVMSLQTPLYWASVRRPMICPSWMPLRCSELM